MSRFPSRFPAELTSSSSQLSRTSSRRTDTRRGPRQPRSKSRCFQVSHSRHQRSSREFLSPSHLRDERESDFLILQQDLTRTEKGNELFLTDPFDLSKTLSEAISVHREECERRGLTIDIVENPSGTPATVLGDRAKVRQIVTNVVGNARKFMFTNRDVSKFT